MSSRIVRATQKNSGNPLPPKKKALLVMLSSCHGKEGRKERKVGRYSTAMKEEQLFIILFLVSLRIDQEKQVSSELSSKIHGTALPPSNTSI